MTATVKTTASIGLVHEAGSVLSPGVKLNLENTGMLRFTPQSNFRLVLTLKSCPQVLSVTPCIFHGIPKNPWELLIAAVPPAVTRSRLIIPRIVLSAFAKTGFPVLVYICKDPANAKSATRSDPSCPPVTEPTSSSSAAFAGSIDRLSRRNPMNQRQRFMVLPPSFARPRHQDPRPC